MDTRLDFIATERRILRFWRESGAFERLRELRQGAPLFRFVDGPITANNPMGVHHAWGRSLKDALLRYKAMRGYSARYQNGFDCQGLWVEVEVEKALGFNGKPDIERFGLERFSRACRERVLEFAGVITDQSIRLGQWMDWPNSYYTHTDANITGIWHFLKRCHERGWVYQGALPMPWCPRCGTSLSEHEMAGSYAEVEHLALYVRATLRADPRRSLIAWTTTPWTLAANVALALDPELTYVEVTRPDWDQTAIVAKDALGNVFPDRDVEIVAELPGAELIGLEYETFLPDLPAQSGIAHRTVAWDQVDAAEGSGIVHIAPGCGREDHELGVELGLAAIAPIDDAGVYLDDFGWLSGRRAFDVADAVADHLRDAGRLLRAGPHLHSFPHCWRCKGELVFRLVKEWFISCDEVRPQLIAAAEAVRFEPEFIAKRMNDWLRNMGDWCISRKRFWGLPLPFYLCASCGATTVIGSLEELRARAREPARVDALPELHRPWIDEVTISCACGAEASRVPEVGDCWLDAGIVPFSTLGYFEDRALWSAAFPAEWICEMREQIRLWYYSMLFMSVVIEGRAPYEKVLSYERVVAEDGTPFSKTGFMIRFDDAVATIGADAIRYLFCRQPPAQECRFGYGVGQVAQRRLTSFWNVASFLDTYAEIDEPAGIAVPPETGFRLDDRWLLARTARFAEIATDAFERWDTPRVLREFESFVDDVSNWYVRISRRRFWRAGAEEDKRGGYAALFAAVKIASQLMAPITPFFCEAVWQDLVRKIDPEAEDSVHHSLWPSPGAQWRDEALLERCERVREVVSLGLRLREQADIRVRQPLPALYVVGDDAGVAALREQEATLRAQLNVKRVVFPDDASGFYRERAGLDFKAAGPVLRGNVTKLRKAIDALDPDVSAELASHAGGRGSVAVPGIETPIDAAWITVDRQLRAGFEAGRSGGFAVWLDTTLDLELEREGFARDLIRRIQLARRDADLDIAQRIELSIRSESAWVREAVASHAQTICDEVLADALVGELGDDATVSVWEREPDSIRIELRPVSGG